MLDYSSILADIADQSTFNEYFRKARCWIDKRAEGRAHYEVDSMIEVTEDLLKEMADKIVAAVNPRMIILFGSHARGTARPDSDLDFIVVEDGPFGPDRSRRAEMVKLWRLLREVRIAKDFLVFTPEEVQKWRDAPNHVVAHALREGRVLYERH